VFFRMLDLRLGARPARPLIITTNLTAAQIAAGQAGVRADPLLRRLLDLCEVVKFKTPDHSPATT